MTDVCRTQICPSLTILHDHTQEAPLPPSQAAARPTPRPANLPGLSKEDLILLRAGQRVQHQVSTVQHLMPRDADIQSWNQSESSHHLTLSSFPPHVIHTYRFAMDVWEVVM